MFETWIGREEHAVDVAAAAPLARLAALLDHATPPWPADEVPPLGHWLYHLPHVRQSDLGEDGHPRRGGFLPPIDLPRRMWAGSRIRFIAPLPIGATITRRSTILSVDDKTSAAGAMVLVTLRHIISVDGTTAIEEEQDLVYLAPRPAAAPRPIDRPAADTEAGKVVDATMLFRFSALTFNAHRIHYDLPYAQSVEGYPALVVHGPLQAMLLIDHALQHGAGRRVTDFAFRARSPLYAGQPIRLAGRDNALWVCDANGATTMTATIGWEER
jgi:3-methylfumaryl-CoA hydratase